MLTPEKQKKKKKTRTKRAKEMSAFFFFQLRLPVHCGFFACVLLRAEAVGVLVHSQFEQRREHLAAQVAAVRQLLLVSPDVFQELI